MLHKLLLTTIGLAALAVASPADARLQLTINASGTTFTCFDGQLGCDLSGGANNLLLVDQTVGAAFVQIALAQSAFGAINQLQLSSSNIVNNGATPLTVTLLASDTDFVGPVHAINNSASLTFNQNIGAPDSTLKFWADALNLQGANPLNTPGTLLETVAGHAVTDPDSFSGSKIAAFDAAGPYSMTEGASLILRGSGSVTGFNQAMESTAIPETRTWAMLGLGFGLMALLGYRKRKDRLQTI